jgi:hypothetical protein
MNRIIENITNFNNIRDYNIKTMPIEDIYRNFGRVLVLCLKNTRLQTKLDVGNYTLIPMSINIIKNTFIKNFLNILDYEFLNTNFKIDRTYFANVDQKELVLNLSNMDEDCIKSFAFQFDGVTKFKDYMIATLLDDYMAYSHTNEIVKTNRINMLQGMAERTYWSLYSNCRLNISLQFMQRGFNLNLTQRLENQQIKDIICKINKYSIEDDNYLNYLYRKQTYVDAASNLKEKGFKLYRITSNPVYSSMDIDTFNKFLDENTFMNDKEFYYLVMNLLSSKELCHYIVNNHDLLQKLKNMNFYSKYYYPFKYLLSYAWLTLYLEESIKKKNMSCTDRFIFDIKTAALLPETPFAIENLTKDCAYLPFLVSSQLYNLPDNIMGVAPRYSEQIRYGIVDFDLFKYRMNLFIAGKTNTNLFNNLNWSSIAISGSIMACCLPNFNPLMLNFMTKAEITGKSSKFLSYINEYYRDADIDMLCNLDGTEFIDKAYYVAETIESNIKSHFKSEELELNKHILVVVKPVKTVAVIINADFIKKYLVNSELSFGDIVTDINNIKVKKAIYPLYLTHKNNKNLEFSSNPSNHHIWTNNIYAPEFDIVSVEQLQIVFAKTKKDKQEDFESNQAELAKHEEALDKQDDDEPDDLVDDENKEYETKEDECKDKSEELEEEFYKKSLIDESNVLFIINENLKFKISSPYMPHSIEMFKIRFRDYFGTVGSFHLPIVRSYYNGETVKMTPSCISACMTMINIDYKYFAGSKDPIEIINKYRCRGYGTILNDKEKIRFFEYNNLVEKWKNIYSIKLNDTLSIRKCLGFKMLTDPMFEFSRKVYNENTAYNAPGNNDVNFTPDRLVEMIHRYKQNSNITLMFKNLKSINEFGFIEPMKHYIIDMAYNICV